MSQHRIFLSHAVEDQQAWIAPLVDALQEKGLNVWFSGSHLSAGPAISEQINAALQSCSIGVAFLSPTFLKKKWTRDELHALATRERQGKCKLLLIRHDLRSSQLSRSTHQLAGGHSFAFGSGCHLIPDKRGKIFGCWYSFSGMTTGTSIFTAGWHLPGCNAARLPSCKK